MGKLLEELKKLEWLEQYIKGKEIVFKDREEVLEKLYSLVFRLEGSGYEDKAEDIREIIKKIVGGSIKLEEGRTLISELSGKVLKKEDLEKLNESDKAKVEFFYKTRKKAFHKNLQEQIELDNPDDIEIAMALTSMITYSLIEMQKVGKEIYKLLDVNILTETVSNFLKGDISTEEVIEIIKNTWGEHLNTRLEVKNDG